MGVGGQSHGENKSKHEKSRLLPNDQKLSRQQKCSVIRKININKVGGEIARVVSAREKYKGFKYLDETQTVFCYTECAENSTGNCSQKNGTYVPSSPDI
jgi:hypothetical protein